MSDTTDPAERLRNDLNCSLAMLNLPEPIRADLRAVVAELEQLRTAANPADADPEYQRWLTRNLRAAFDAGWHAHADLVTGTMATLGAEKRHSVGTAWVTERLAHLQADEQPEPEPCDGDCDCDCQPGQPCLCPERDCYCGPCRVCGETPQQRKEDGRG